MPANTVEAVLKSRYEDGVDKGVENTRALMEKSFASMKDASAAAAAGIDSAFNSAVGSLESWRTNLSKAADESDSGFKKMGLGAAAVGLAFAEVFLRAAKAAADFVVEIVKEASEVAAARFSFEHLTAAQGENADLMLGKLKQATEGQIGQLSLLRNANKVLQGDLPLTGEQYLKLTENVARLAKSAGTDATAAQDALTTALIRGMSRGLGPALGLHLAVKDAVAAMAEEMNTSAASMPDHSKLQAFYNDLLDKTDTAVAKLGPQFVTLEEALTHAKVTWHDFLDDMGTAITRSGVFQGLLVKLTEGLNGVNTSMDQQHRIALATNDALIETLRIIASISGAIAPFVTFLETLGAGFRGLVLAIMSFFLDCANAVIATVDAISDALAWIFPVADKAADNAVNAVKKLRQEINGMAEDARYNFEHNFDGVGNNEAKLKKLSEAANGLAAEMEGLRGKVLDGAAGIQQHGAAAEKAAGDTKALTEQLAKYREMLFSLNQATATPEQKSMNELMHQVEEIGKLDKISADQRNDLYAAARAKYDAEVAKQYEEEKRRQVEQNDRKLAAQKQYQNQVQTLDNELALASATEEEKAFIKRQQDIDKVNKLVWSGSEEGKRLLLLVEKQYDAEMDKLHAARLAKEQAAEKKAIDDAIAAGNAIAHAVEAAGKRTVSQDTALKALGNLPQVMDTLKAKLAELNKQPVVTDAQITQIEKLKTAIDQLNKLNFKPFEKALTEMKQQMQQQTTQALQSFGQYLGGLLKGQADTSKSLLQMAGDMIGGLFSMAGTLLIQTGVAECAAALTMVGRAMGASFTGGLEAIAAGVALTALGSGLSSSGASSSGASAAAAPQQSSSTSSNANPQILSVGAPRGSQATNPQQTQHLVQLEIKPNDAYTVKLIQNNLQTNGALRTVIKRG